MFTDISIIHSFTFRLYEEIFVLFLQKSLTPNLSEDLAISFYIQSHKLILAVYQIYWNQGVMKYDSTHAECSIPWLNEVLVLFTVGLQLCQQLKDKVSNVFFNFDWI